MKDFFEELPPHLKEMVYTLWESLRIHVGGMALQEPEIM